MEKREQRLHVNMPCTHHDIFALQCWPTNAFDLVLHDYFVGFYNILAYAWSC